MKKILKKKKGDVTLGCLNKKNAIKKIAMGKIKILLTMVLLTVGMFSCSDDNAIKNETATEQSVALRTVLNKLKLEHTVTHGKNAIAANPATAMLCFDFVYPMTFSYNNGTTVTVANLDGLLSILQNESPNMFLAGVVFPFQVQSGGALQTINNEQELTALIQQCGVPTFVEDLQHTFCFDLVYPIQLNYNGVAVTINSQSELMQFGDAPGFNGVVEVVFPISVVYQNQTVVLNSTYDFYQMVNNCNAGSCNCPQNYEPVCVQTPNGIVEFGNMCFAQCAGYTQNDLVPCNSSQCIISNLSTTVGNCNPSGGYSLTINFTYTNPSSDHFVVYNSLYEPIGTYLLSALPITIDNYPIMNNSGADFLTVDFGVNSNCSSSQQWATPNCGGCVCPTDYTPVCVVDNQGNTITFSNACNAECAGYTPNDFVTCTSAPFNFSQALGSCFNIAYPVQVQYGGAVHTVNSDGDLLQYFNPNSGPIPIMTYPIVVSFAGGSYTFMNQQAFQNQIQISCP